MPNKRERIVLAANNLLKTGNYQNMSTAKIAKIAGVAEGTLYRYFKNKDDIFIDAVNYTLKNLQGVIFRGNNKDYQLSKNLNIIITNIYKIVGETENIYKIYYKAFSEIENPRVKKLLANWLSDNLNCLKEIFLWAIENKELKLDSENLDFIVRFVWGTAELILREGALGIREESFITLKKNIEKVRMIITFLEEDPKKIQVI